jgi:hypothetical protein
VGDRDEQFKGRRSAAEVILWAVRWCLKVRISYRDYKFRAAGPICIERSITEARLSTFRSRPSGMRKLPVSYRKPAHDHCGQERRLRKVSGGDES